MSTDVLRLPRINQSMTSATYSSNRDAERSGVPFPAVTIPDNRATYEQQLKKGRRNRRTEISRQRSMREHGNRISNAPFQSSNTPETGKTTKGGQTGGFTHEHKQRGTALTPSPYTDSRHSPTRSRTAVTSSVDNDKETKTGPNKSRSLGSSRTTRTEPDGSLNRDNVVTLPQLSRYRSTVLVYLDAGWKNSRKDRFYSTLEDAQVKQWKQKRLMALQHQQNLQVSKERQLEQLRHIRQKHQLTRNRRLNNQHVKWKYVISGKEGDRKEYGLPSEYYTLYGFHPEKTSSPGEEKKAVRSKTAQTQKNSREALAKEKNGLRKRNRQRYEYLFATKRNTQLEMIQKIIRDGLYTLDVSAGNFDAEQPHGKQSHSRPSKGATSNVIVKNVIDDAKKVISSQENEIQSELESNSGSNVDLPERGKK